MNELVLATTVFGANIAAQPILNCINCQVFGRYFDWKHNVDTARSVAVSGLEIESRNRSRAQPYMATPARTLRSIIGALRLNYSKFVFVDVGSGKGRSMLVASEFPFKKIIGIEFARDLVTVARRNIRHYRNPRQKCRDIKALHIDVENFEIPDDNCVFYLFNPFDRELTQSFVDLAAQAFKQNRQKMFFIL